MNLGIGFSSNDIKNLITSMLPLPKQEKGSHFVHKQHL